jgi:hypothetical protein
MPFSEDEQKQLEQAAQDTNRALGFNAISAEGLGRLLQDLRWTEALAPLKTTLDKFMDEMARLGFTFTLRGQGERRDGRRRHMQGLKRDRRDKRRKRGYR